MDKQEILNKLNAVAKPTNDWLEEAKLRVEKRKTLRYSQEIALKILRELRSQKKSQADLASAMKVSPQQISKWVKGGENFTLETIAKIEEVLKVNILTINFVEKTPTMVSNIQTHLGSLYERRPGSYSRKSTSVDCKIINIQDYQTPTKLVL